MVQPCSFKLRKGSLKSKRHTHVDEGFQFALAFCGDCGSPIYAEPYFDPDAEPGSGPYVVQVGTLDSTGPLVAIPVKELNVKHRLGWVGALAGAEQKKEYS